MRKGLVGEVGFGEDSDEGKEGRAEGLWGL